MTGRTETPETSSAPGAPDAVVILDFGSQYSQLIARRVRECQVYCELVPHDAAPDRVLALRPKGLILSGGPRSVYEAGAPQLPPYVVEAGLPVLGICYGVQLLAHYLGGAVAPTSTREYGVAEVEVLEPEAPVFKGLPRRFQVWMSHGDSITTLPPGFRVLARSQNAAVAAIADGSGRIGLQFHPEVAHTPLGKEILARFLFDVCGCRPNWTPGSYVEQAIEAIRHRVGEERAICALSGGVDSAVAATLVHRAIGDRLTCVFVDNGLLRKDEAQRVLDATRDRLGLPVVHVDATRRFLDALRGVEDPEEKRRRIGRAFVDVFVEEARRLGNPRFLVQGTLYPDVIESAPAEARAAAKIKTHHNVGGLPPDLPFVLVEPLRYLFKDEVRRVGRALGLPDEFVFRHPFPGPGLAVRIVGEVTEDRLETVRAADAIVLEELRRAGLDRDVWQAFAVLTPLRTVGVMGDARTYGNLVAVRAVTSDDGMTADWARLPSEVLARIATRIVNEVPGVNRVVYDISSKPPSTIEWE